MQSTSLGVRKLSKVCPDGYEGLSDISFSASVRELARFSPVSKTSENTEQDEELDALDACITLKRSGYR
jgi:hypothetical protein